MAEANKADIDKLTVFDGKSVNIGNNFSPEDRIIPFFTALRLCASLVAIINDTASPREFSDTEVMCVYIISSYLTPEMQIKIHLYIRTHYANTKERSAYNLYYLITGKPEEAITAPGFNQFTTSIFDENTVAKSLNKAKITQLITDSIKVLSSATITAYGHLLLYEAIKANRVPASAALLRKRVNPNKAFSGTTQLHEWALCRTTNIAYEYLCDLLVTFKTDLNQLNFNGYSPCMLAASIGNEKALNKLIQLGAELDITKDGKTAQKLAEENGHTVCAKMIQDTLKQSATSAPGM
jgi:hypothetical protein